MKRNKSKSKKAQREIPRQERLAQVAREVMDNVGLFAAGEGFDFLLTIVDPNGEGCWTCSTLGCGKGDDDAFTRTYAYDGSHLDN